MSDDERLRNTEENPDHFEDEFGGRFDKDEAERLNRASQALSANELNYTNDGEPSRKSLRNAIRLNSKRRKLVAGGAAGAALGGGIIALFITMAPLRIMGYVTSIENFFYGPAEAAVQAETDQLFSSYLKKYIMPGMTLNGVCSSTKTITKECINTPSDSNVVQKLYRGWRDGRLENHLANAEQFVEVKRRPDGTYWLRTPQTTGDGIDVTQLRTDPNVENIFDTDGFRRANSRQEVRMAFRAAIQDETRWKQVMYRFKVGRLLEKKYGIKRCLLACQSRDRISDKFAEKKFAGPAFIIERALQKRSTLSGLAFACFISECSLDKETNTVDINRSDNGEPLSEFDRQISQAITELAARHGTEKLSTLVGEVEKLKEAGSMGKYMTNLALEKMLAKAGVQAAGDLATKISNPVGWVAAAAKLASTAAVAGATLKVMAYELNSQEFVSTYAMFRTASDEIKNNNLDMDELGSLTALLEDGMRTDGSGVPAEAIPAYQVISGGGSLTLSSLSNPLFPRAFAESKTTGSNYTCENGQATATACLSLNYENAFTQVSQGIASIPGMSFIVAASNLMNQISGAIGSALADLMNYTVPGFSNALEFVSQMVAPVGEYFMGFAIPDPMKNPDGGRLGEAGIVGGDVSANYFTHRQLGGQVATSVEMAEMRKDYSDQQQWEFSGKSIAYRLFSDDSRSLASRMATAMPLSITGGAQAGVANLVNAPFGIFGVLSSAFRPQTASAASAWTDDWYGVTQYTVPLSDKVYRSDPETYLTKYNCNDPSNGLTAAWNAAAIGEADDTYGATGYINENNGQAENTTTNYCAFIQSVAGSAGGKYTSSVLTADDLGETDAQASIGGGSYTPGKFNFLDTSPCPANTDDMGLVKTRYNGSFSSVAYPTIRLCRLHSISGTGHTPSGNIVSGGAILNRGVAEVFERMGQKAKAEGYSLSANSSFRLADSCGGRASRTCAAPGKSPHQLGVAVDFGAIKFEAGPDTMSCARRETDPNSRIWVWLSRNAAKDFGIKQLTHEPWHWDVIPMSNRCS